MRDKQRGFSWVWVVFRVFPIDLPLPHQAGLHGPDVSGLKQLLFFRDHLIVYLNVSSFIPITAREVYGEFFLFFLKNLGWLHNTLLLLLFLHLPKLSKRKLDLLGLLPNHHCLRPIIQVPLSFGLHFHRLGLRFGLGVSHRRVFRFHVPWPVGPILDDVIVWRVVDGVEPNLRYFYLFFFIDPTIVSVFIGLAFILMEVCEWLVDIGRMDLSLIDGFFLRMLIFGREIVSSRIIGSFSDSAIWVCGFDYL